LSDDGRMKAQADGPLLGLRADLLNAPTSWEMTDYRRLATSGSSTRVLLLGVYDFVTGQRYPAEDDNRLLTDNALVLETRPCPD